MLRMFTPAPFILVLVSDGDLQRGRAVLFKLLLSCLRDSFLPRLPGSQRRGQAHKKKDKRYEVQRLPMHKCFPCLAVPRNDLLFLSVMSAMGQKRPVSGGQMSWDALHPT
jgi:hypothetical protein